MVSLLLRHGPIEDARPAPSTSSGRGLRQSQDRLATNGDDPRIASNAWVLQAVWFDTPRRGTAGRLTTNGGRGSTGARKTGGSGRGCFKSRRISFFDKLRTNVTGSGPFVVSLSNHEFTGLIEL